MSWIASSLLTASLPDHCQPENEFLHKLSSVLGTCIPTPLALTSTLLGVISMIAWLCAQLPQIYKNWRIQSTSGLSIFFLVEWCLGDVSNLLGALFTHQATWQVAIGAYYVFVDLCLVGQWVWYERLRHGHPVFRIKKSTSDRNAGGAGGAHMQHVTIEGRPLFGGQGSSKARPPTRPQIIFRSPTFNNGKSTFEKPSPSSGSLSATPRGTVVRAGGSFPMPSPSPRTILMIACLIAVVAGSPVQPPPSANPALLSAPLAAADALTPLEQAGTILAWISTVLYLGSRIPQLIKNWQRKSTAGLSPHLFIAAFLGNLFYSSALITNPNAWNDFGPYGGGGWAGADGNDRSQWVLATLPFFLGAAGVLALDGSVGVQFLIYGEAQQKLVVVEGQGPNREWRWRRVSGWMRGWIPTSVSGAAAEQEALIGEADSVRGEGYGTL